MGGNSIKHVIWPLWESCPRKDRNAFSFVPSRGCSLARLYVAVDRATRRGNRTGPPRAKRNDDAPVSAPARGAGRRQKARQPNPRRHAAYWIAVENQRTGTNPGSCPPLDHVIIYTRARRPVRTDWPAGRGGVGPRAHLPAWGHVETSARVVFSSRSARRIWTVRPIESGSKLAGYRTRGIFLGRGGLGTRRRGRRDKIPRRRRALLGPGRAISPFTRAPGRPAGYANELIMWAARPAAASPIGSPAGGL